MDALIEIFKAARELVARPDNDFMWSSWEDAPDALEEIDGIIQRLEQGPVDPGSIAVLFAPTGPMQELALSSGWSESFLELADRFDAAVGQLES